MIVTTKLSKMTVVRDSFVVTITIALSLRSRQRRRRRDSFVDRGRDSFVTNWKEVVGQGGLVLAFCLLFPAYILGRRSSRLCGCSHLIPKRLISLKIYQNRSNSVKKPALFGFLKVSSRA